MPARSTALALAERHPEQYDVIENNFTRAGTFVPSRSRRSATEWRLAGQHEGEPVYVRGRATHRDVYPLAQLMKAHRAAGCPADRVVSIDRRSLGGRLYGRRMGGREYRRLAAQMERLEEVTFEMRTRIGRRTIPYRRFGLVESFDLETGRVTISEVVAEIAASGGSLTLVDSEQYVRLLRSNELAAALWAWVQTHDWRHRRRRRIPGNTAIALLGLADDEHPRRARGLVERAAADVILEDPLTTIRVVDRRRGRGAEWWLDIERVLAADTGVGGGEVRVLAAADTGVGGGEVRVLAAAAEHEIGPPVKGVNGVKEGVAPRRPSWRDAFTPRQLEVLDDIDGKHVAAGERGWAELHVQLAQDQALDPFEFVLEENRRWRDRRRAAGQRAAGVGASSPTNPGLHDGRHGHGCMVCFPTTAGSR